MVILRTLLTGSSRWWAATKRGIATLCALVLGVALLAIAACAEDTVRALPRTDIVCDPHYDLVAGACLPAPGRIVGRVCDRYAGQWLADIRITLLSDGDELTTFTDLNGRFSFESVPAGVQELRAVADGYANSFIANVPPGQEVTIGASECVSIVGGLTGRACDPSGGPLIGASVAVDDLAGTTTLADVDGLFTLERLIAADYVLTIRRGGDVVESRAVTVVAGELIDLGSAACPTDPTVNPNPDPLADLHGNACAPELGFIENGTVIVSIGNARFETTTGVAGYFELRGLPPGDHELTLFVDNSYSVTVPVTAVADQDTEVIFGVCGEAWTYSHELSICGTLSEVFVVPPVDLVFVVDTTGSMTGPIQNLQTSIIDILNSVTGLVDDAQIGIAHFEDFPLYAAPTDIAYRLLQPLTSDTTLLQSAVMSLTDMWGFPIGGGGGDIASAYEAVYQAATGAGLDVDQNGSFNDLSQGDVPPGPPGWRDGSARMIILVTDTNMRNPDLGDAVPAGAHSGTETIAAAQAAGINVLGIAAGNDAVSHMETLANATGAVIADGFDADGDGLFVNPGDIPPGGPLVFRTDGFGQLLGTVGSDVAYAITAAVDAILPTRVVVQLVGVDAAGLEIVTDPPFYEGLVVGDEACFTVTVTGEVPLGEEPTDKDVRIEVAWEDGTTVSSEGVTISPDPPTN